MEWKTIDGYENYEVSSNGEVRKINKANDPRTKQYCYLKAQKNNCGYLRYTLYKNGKSKVFAAHRLVALSFIPNPKNLPQINHKDNNKENNNIENLEWCSALYNNMYGGHNIKVANSLCKKVRAYNLKDEFIKEYNSIKDAAKDLGLNPAAISQILNNSNHHSINGYKWRYVND